MLVMALGYECEQNGWMKAINVLNMNQLLLWYGILSFWNIIIIMIINEIAMFVKKFHTKFEK